MTKGCEGMGGKKQQQERAAPTAYKKRISADMRHMGGRELARNECFKRRSLAQLRETCGLKSVRMMSEWRDFQHGRGLKNHYHSDLFKSEGQRDWTGLYARFCFVFCICTSKRLI